MSSTNTTIEGFMSLPDNQKYTEIRFYNSGFGNISADELYVSKFGAIHIHGGVKAFYPATILIYHDVANKTVDLGESVTYEKLGFRYNNIFYV